MFEHVDTLKTAYGRSMKAGIIAPEFALFCLICFSVFAWWEAVRQYALVAELVLGLILLLHMGAIIGHDSSDRLHPTGHRDRRESQW